MRPAAWFLSATVLIAPGPAHANVNGSLELESNTNQNLSAGADGSPSTLLMERLSLRYAGLPFGPSVAVATLGGAFSNATGWMGNGTRTDGRVVSFDASIGFLPRRAVPLRLYGSGTFDAGTSGVLASQGAGPSYVYGGALNLEPGKVVPGLRLDANESRSSRPGHPDGSDVQRRLVASSYGTVARQRVNLGLRLENDQRDGAGEITSTGATLNVSSAPHQTTLLASEVRRSLPSLAGITSDRMLSGDSNQRWSPALGTNVGIRVSEAGAAGAKGTLGDARAGFTWVALPGAQQLTLAGGASAGRARTSAALNEGSGDSYGASARAGFSTPVSRLTAGLGAGASLDTCDCSFGNDGTTTRLDASLSAGLPLQSRGSAQADYKIVRALAPSTRGGDRTEHHARATGRLAAGPRSELNATLSYDDGQRELLDITTGRASSQRERVMTGSVGVNRYLGTLSLSGDVRVSRGSLVTSGSFVVGQARQTRTSTGGQVTMAWRPVPELGVRAQGIGTWTTLEDDTSMGSFAANAALDWRLGLITASVQYQATRVELVNVESSFQHSVRVIVARPFEL